MKAKPNYNVDIDDFATHRPSAWEKGKSFNMTGEWQANTRYYSDEYITDFVVYNGALLACKKEHISDSGNEPVLIYDDHEVVVGVHGDIWLFVIASGLNSTAYDIYVKHLEDPSTAMSEKEWISYMMQKVVTHKELEVLGIPMNLDVENAVRFDVDQTAKSDDEKLQARKNIDAAWEQEIVIAEGDLLEDYTTANILNEVALRYTPQQLSPSQIQQAQENLHIADEDRIIIIEKKIDDLDEKGITTIGDIDDLRKTYYASVTEAHDTPPDFIVTAMNTLADFLGDPELDQVKLNEGTANTIESINLLYQKLGVKIVDKTMPEDNGRIRYRLVDRNGAPLVGSLDILVPQDNNIHKVEIVEGGVVIGPEGPSYVAGTGHWWLKMISGYFDDVHMVWVDIPPVYCLIDNLIYKAKEEIKPNDPSGLPYEGATIQMKIEEQEVVDPSGVTTTFQVVSGDIMEDTVAYKHLDEDAKKVYDFSGYDFTIDPASPEDYYIRCRAAYPGAIRLTPEAYAADPDIIDKLVPPYKTGEMYYTYVRKITAAKELLTDAETLREGVNELVARYPVSIEVYQNGIVNPDGKTADEDDQYTYVVKQRVDSADISDIETIHVPLSYEVVKVEPKIAEGNSTEWLGNLKDTIEYKNMHPELFAEEKDSLLDFTVTNGKMDMTDPDNPVQIFEHIYCRTNVYFVKDEVTDNEVKMVIEDPTDVTKAPVEKTYATPEAVLEDFEETPQIQLYISGYDNQLSAKLLFEDDHILGKEIIP